MLRRRMGKAGQARARETFDWTAIIPQYQTLWREQRAIRLARNNKGPSARSALRGPDPSFCHVAERHLSPLAALRPDPLTAMTELRSLLRFTAPSLPSELDEAGTSKLLAELHRRGEATVRELLEVLEPARRGAGQRAVL